mgnify:FL=1
MHRETNVVLLDDLDESGVVEVREVPCRSPSHISADQVRHGPSRLTEVVHVRDHVREVLLEVDEAVLELVVVRVVAPVVRDVLLRGIRFGSSDLGQVRRRAGRRGRAGDARLARRGADDERLDLRLVRRDLGRELGDLG